MPTSTSCRRRFATFLLAAVALSAVACQPAVSPSVTLNFSGAFGGQMIVTTTTGPIVCVSTRSLDGTLRISLTQPSSSVVNTSFNGTGVTTGTIVELSVVPVVGCGALPGNNVLNATRVFTGTETNIAFSSSSTTTTPNGAGAVTCVDSIAFSGLLVGATITGTFTYTTACQGNNGVNAITGTGTIAIPVALR